MFEVDMLEARKVIFLKPIHEDDFPERGMKAWLTKIERSPEDDDHNGVGYKLYFDFSEFDRENDKYFVECYYPNVRTRDLTTKALYTAKEAGLYSPKYSVHFTETNLHNGEMRDLSNFIMGIR